MSKTPWQLVRERRMTDDLGPWRRLEVVAGNWTIVAEEIPFWSGAEWSVRAEHVGGTCVPPGPNLHRNPTAEVDRLVRLIDWPRFDWDAFSVLLAKIATQAVAGGGA
jgi:hypothetical protein